MINWIPYLLAIEVPLPGLGILVTILLFFLLHGGVLIWNIATLKNEVKGLGTDIKRLDDTLHAMSNYDTRLALLEKSTESAHKRVDMLITKLNVNVTPEFDVRSQR